MRVTAWVVGERPGEHFMEPVVLVDEVPCPECGVEILGTFVTRRYVIDLDAGRSLYWILCPECHADVEVEGARHAS